MNATRQLSVSSNQDIANLGVPTSDDSEDNVKPRKAVELSNAKVVKSPIKQVA